MAKGKRLKVKGWVAAVACVVALVVLPCKVVHGAGVVIGGYDVVKIAKETVSILKEKKLVPESSITSLGALLDVRSSDPLISGTSIVGFYSDLGKLLVEKNIASQKEIDAAKTAAAKSGGVKIGGVNPVVLAASYLDILVRKNLLTLQSAQSVLDSAKSK